MSVHEVPDSDVTYHLVRYDEQGGELPEDDGPSASEQVVAAAKDGVTDVFLLAHGWKGDVRGAIRQYDRWIGSMAQQQADRDRIRTVVPAFKALVVGLHWPSLPYGDESAPAMLLGADQPPSEDEPPGDEFALEAAMDVSTLVDDYTDCLAPASEDPARVEAVRTALTTIITAADDPAVAAEVAQGRVPPHVLAAYTVLADEFDSRPGDVGGAPGDDDPAFDPTATVADRIGSSPAPTEDALLGIGDGIAALARKAKDALLMPVRQLSFWRMKRRAKVVGEHGMHELLASIQVAAPGARIHLMGHSFGCIVVSAAVAGRVSPGGVFRERLPRAVDTVFLVQGAMSLWSFADAVPFAPGSHGHFQPLLVDPSAITGPIVTTQSSFDLAVGVLYPLGARVVNDALLGVELPKFGGIGSFGIQGRNVEGVRILATTEEYGFRPGHVYNVDASRVIRHGGGPSGAHSDISHPEVAHVMWQAVTASVLASSPTLIE